MSVFSSILNEEAVAKVLNIEVAALDVMDATRVAEAAISEKFGISLEEAAEVVELVTQVRSLSKALACYTTNGMDVCISQSDAEQEPDAATNLLGWIKWWRNLSGESLQNSRDLGEHRRRYSSLSDCLRRHRR